MNPFYVLVYLATNAIVKANLFAAVLLQCSIFTAACCPDGGCRNHMGVAQSYCNELLKEVMWSHILRSSSSPLQQSCPVIQSTIPSSD